MRLQDVGCLILSLSFLVVPSIIAFSVLFHSGVPYFILVALIAFPIWIILFTRFWMRRMGAPADWDSTYNGVDGPTDNAGKLRY